MTLNRRRLLAGAAGALILPMLPGHAHANETEVAIVGGHAFGTYWRGTIPAGVDAAAVSATVTAVVAGVDQSMSPYRADSEITRFNLQRGAGSMDASSDLCAVASESMRVARLTNGAFDPTIGPLVHRYGFGPIAGGLGSYAGIEVGEHRLGKLEGRLTLDLCGVAKGFALDSIVAALARDGITDFLIELGGEVKAAGHHPTGRPWQIGVEGPGEESAGIKQLVRPDGLALATSGATVNGLDYRGRRYGHIIDPRTHASVDSRVLSVSVLAPTAMEADALATALFVMGDEDGVTLARSINRPALFIVKERGRVVEKMAAGFAAHILA